MCKNSLAVTDLNSNCYKSLLQHFITLKPPNIKLFSDMIVKFYNATNKITGVGEGNSFGAEKHLLKLFCC